MYALDQTWLPFSNLMLKHIYNVLLICSDYDRFMLEEDGRVEEELYKEYMDLGLSTPPKITHTTSEEEALRLIETFSFDLTITMIDFKSGKVESLAEKIKQIKPNMPVVVLAPAPDHRKMKALKKEKNAPIDQVFYWQGDPKLFLAMIKLIEDAQNLEHDTSVADVQVIILIEDSVRFISSYLPKMYTCLIQQNRLSIMEALNDWGKTLRMRGRPKIVLARDGEKGMEYYQKYKKNILGIITDVNFPYEGLTEGSGIRLAKEIRAENAELPILLQSTDQKHKATAKAIGADFLWKNSPDLLSGLERHFINQYNFGPFKFIDPKTGEVLMTASTMKELQHDLMKIPIESFIYHSRRNDFSRWLRAQSLYQLAASIKQIQYREGEDQGKMREYLYNVIKDYRTQRTRGVIAEFSPWNYDETSFFSRIGKGSLGGKGRGLAFIAAEMKANKIQEQFPELYLSIPKTVVVSTSLFETFMESNHFDVSKLAKMRDHDILKLFLAKKAPAELTSALKAVLKIVTQPISVRSSSLLEDSHSEPFAGVYQTCMISNLGTLDKRLKELENAVKTVWASVFFSRAREYLKITDHRIEEEKMAVIIQQITGSVHGDYFYPNISGVGRSVNYYPIGNQRSEDGVGMLSFGFGKSVVDDGQAFRFCPAKPKLPSDSLSGRGVSQADFYALNMTKPFDPLVNMDNLELLPLAEAEKYPKALKNIASTLNLETGAVSESSFAEGPKIITFNGMLKYDMFPLAKVMDTILKLGQECMSTPVEIEIAVNTERPAEKRPDFSILQIRPIASAYTESDVVIEEWEKEDALVFSDSVMGNGAIDSIFDIICLKKDAFKASEMIDMSAELAMLNAETEGKEYVLITAGRLGSTDRWLGIPCAWSDISHAHVIVEVALEDLQVEPSQGTHFFQNMTSLGCIYLTVNPVVGDGLISYEKISKLTLVSETKHFIHVVAEKSLDIRANGLEKQAIIKLKKEKERWD